MAVFETWNLLSELTFTVADSTGSLLLVAFYFGIGLLLFTTLGKWVLRIIRKEK